MTDSAPPPTQPKDVPAQQNKRIWPYTIPIWVIFVAALGGVYFPFVNQPTLWFGMPAIGVWIAIWVLAIPLALAFVEHVGGYGRIDDARDIAGGHIATQDNSATDQGATR